MCLGGDFVGGRLAFCGRVGAPDHRALSAEVDHAVGRAYLPLGRHRHGVARLDAGERANFVLWARSSQFRAAAAYGRVPPDGYPPEAPGEIDLVCLSEPNDRDYAAQFARLANPPRDAAAPPRKPP